ncbi:DNA polymerase III subunit delta' [Clostridia bacterium]|nr:DNA polymerase III subunit delta' [Clostridia bacterium]
MDNRELLVTMRERGRLPHSILFYGETDRTEMALFTAQTILKDENPKIIAENKHPDVIWVEHSGKLGGFSVETIRNTCADAFIKPNNSSAKVYIFDGADNITNQAQNALLKLVEEPPDTVYFIFTAKSKSVFLDTMISRMTCLSLPNSENSENTIQNELVAKTINAVLCNNEFDVLTLLSSIENKDDFLVFLKDFENSLISSFSYNSASKIYENIRNCYSQLHSNTSIKLITTNLCSGIFS